MQAASSHWKRQGNGLCPTASRRNQPCPHLTPAHLRPILTSGLQNWKRTNVCKPPGLWYFVTEATELVQVSTPISRRDLTNTQREIHLARRASGGLQGPAQVHVGSPCFSRSRQLPPVLYSSAHWPTASTRELTFLCPWHMALPSDLNIHKSKWKFP